MATVSQLGEVLSWVLCTSHIQAQPRAPGHFALWKALWRGVALEFGVSGTLGPR